MQVLKEATQALPESQAKGVEGILRGAVGGQIVVRSKLYGNKNGGKEWDDGTYSGIRKITVTGNKGTLTSLQVDYGVDQKVVVGSVHGNSDGQETVFELDYPGECLQKISGYYGPHDGCLKIKSLTFETDQGAFGPVGTNEKTDTYFEITGRGKIVGFFGRADAEYLYAIGVCTKA